MRRQLLAALPALARWFHVMPWDVERLTFEEVNTFVEAIPRTEV